MSLRHKEIELIHRKQIRDIQSQLQLSTNIIQEVFETLKSGGTESSYIINLCETYLRENHFVNNDSYVHVNPNYMSVHNGIESFVVVFRRALDCVVNAHTVHILHIYNY